MMVALVPNALESDKSEDGTIKAVVSFASFASSQPSVTGEKVVSKPSIEPHSLVLAEVRAFAWVRAASL